MEFGGFSLSLGGDVGFYRVPELLKRTHGESPKTYRLFVRLRIPVGSMGRMWGQTMARPMRYGH